MKKIFILSLLLSSAMTVAMEREESSEGSSPVATQQQSTLTAARSVSWEDLFSGKFNKLSQEDALKLTLQANKSLKTSPYEALDLYKQLAQAGYATAMIQCAKLTLEQALSIGNESLSGKLSKKELKQKEEVFKSLLAESWDWTWLYYLKRVVDSHPKDPGDYREVIGSNLKEAKSKYFKKFGGDAFKKYRRSIEVICRPFEYLDLITPNYDTKILSVLNQLCHKKADIFEFLNQQFVIDQFCWLASLLGDEEKYLLYEYIYNSLTTKKSYKNPKNTPIFLNEKIKDHIDGIILEALGCPKNYFSSLLKYLSSPKPDTDPKAEKLLMRCQNLPEARVSLAEMYMEGRAGKEFTQEERDEEAIRLLLTCQDRPDARWNLASAYIEGRVGKNLSQEERDKEAMNLLLTCQEFSASRFSLAFLYKHGRIGKNLSQEERDEEAIRLLLTCQDLQDARFHLAMMYVYRRAGKDFTHDQREQRVQELSNDLPDHLLAFIENARQLQKIIEMLNPSEAVLANSLEQLHQKELATGEASQLTEKLAEVLQEESLEDESTEALAPESSEETVVEIPSSSNQPAVFVESQKEGAKTASKTNPTKKDKQAQKERKRQAMVAEIQKLAGEEQQKLMRKVTAMGIRGGNPAEAPQQERQIVFASPEVEAEYQAMLANDKQGKKLTEMIKDILFYGHRLEGMGKPEILTSGNYKGCWSRRINGKDRIVYRVEGNAIKIFEAEGHYQKS